ncbi:hypothetical protein JCM9140_2150 [Halalkalibacter wakoensis JCM 9140]|uniref:Uncharacterized protein n=1 Tax=Halalkalibacter wakoensis JCM 9140 TaxID=1236970 RepID=W4Q215_9BACI|nr:hypothetical protein [Halalkalibacter wakoensis]GAE26121.1 hypothetical protein JCM9140_2150 [Halalkalibacter wakoensis JCM 9140]
MSDYQQFIDEKEKIDLLFERGYEIKRVIENLSGAFVDFSQVISGKENDFIQLHIKTAEARKYFVTKMIQDQTEKSM